MNLSSGMLLLIQLASMTSQHSFSTFEKRPEQRNSFKLLGGNRRRDKISATTALISETGQGERSRNLLPWGGGTQQGIFQPISNKQRSEKKICSSAPAITGCTFVLVRMGFLCPPPPPLAI